MLAAKGEGGKRRASPTKTKKKSKNHKRLERSKRGKQKERERDDAEKLKVCQRGEKERERDGSRVASIVRPVQLKQIIRDGFCRFLVEWQR